MNACDRAILKVGTSLGLGLLDFVVQTQFANKDNTAAGRHAIGSMWKFVDESDAVKDALECLFMKKESKTCECFRYEPVSKGLIVKQGRVKFYSE